LGISSLPHWKTGRGRKSCGYRQREDFPLHTGFETGIFQMSLNFRDQAHEAGIPTIPGQCGEYIVLDLVNIV